MRRGSEVLHAKPHLTPINTCYWQGIVSLSLPLSLLFNNRRRGEMKVQVGEELQSMEKGETDIAFNDGEDTRVTNYRGWKAMPYVIGNETFEKLGTLGTSSNLLVYLTTVFHMKSVAAATLINVFNGTTNFTPIIGAFLSDTYFGRYKTLGIASIASLIGMLILTLTSGITSLHPHQLCGGANQPCAEPTAVQLAVLFASFAFLIVGAGGIRPCNLAFGADQFNPGTESGRRGINSFFNWYYFTFTFAMMLSATVIIYVQSNISWTLGLGIPTVLMFFSCSFFFIGSPIYVKVRPEGSPFASIAQVLVAAFRKHGLDLPGDRELSLFNPPLASSLNSKLHYTEQFRFLDKAAIITTTDQTNSDGSATNPWRLSTLQQVEEVKCVARIVPVWSAGIIYYIALVQQSNFVVLQALQSDRYLGNAGFEIPAGSFVVFTMLALTIWIPIYDRILIPRLQRITGKEGGITLLQKMGTGIVLSIVAMVVAALVEVKRRSHVTGAHNTISSMSSLWFIPQLVLCGLSEAFNVIGQVEFYYKQFPENMRSVAGSVFFLGMACSNYLSGFMVTIVHQTTGGGGKESWLAGDLNEGRLEYFYFAIAMIGVVNLFYFIVCARWYKYKGVDRGSSSEIAMEAEKLKAPPV